MTNLEAIQEDLQPYPIRVNLIKRKLEKHGIEPGENVRDEKAIARIVIEILTQMLTLNNVGEGGSSISFSKEGLEAYITSLAKQFGLDSSDYIKEPTVTCISE